MVQHIKVLLLTSIGIFLVLLISCSLFHNALAESPAFDQTFVTDEQMGDKGNDWVQTYGNGSTHLRSDYINILAVDYVSDGKTLNATLWFKSNLENASTFNQPFKKIRYGMLIAIGSMPPNSGYNGANYNYYIEAVGGKWSEYLYQLSSTGASALVESKRNFTESFGGTTIGPGYVKLRLDLNYIHYPRGYGLSFYTAESFKANEVRDFTNWVAIPPAIIGISTSPKNVVIRQGETHLIPTEINTPFSNNVTSISFDKNTDFSSSGLYISTQRIHPPLFRVVVSPQTPVGVYSIGFVASMLISTRANESPTGAAATGPVERETGLVDPEFQVSKKYPTIGYVRSPANITIDVIQPPSISETFSEFWHTYGQLIAIFAGGLVGAFSTLAVEIVAHRGKKEEK